MSTSAISHSSYAICNEVESSAIHSNMGDLENVTMLSESKSA